MGMFVIYFLVRHIFYIIMIHTYDNVDLQNAVFKDKVFLFEFEMNTIQKLSSS